ncbi:MAG: murein DD-endopeptidase MepM/ murein hydrolase activator NlpD [Glaciecola sp.]|jgi:murein DD-endopeptidase MepM/ murein hydrolase activator NlpD
MSQKKMLFAGLLLAFVGTLFSGKFIESSSIASSELDSGQYLDFKLKIEAMDESGLILLIDSLLEKPSNPLYLKLLNDRVGKYYLKHKIESESPYPADEFYHSWNTLLSHPYKDKLSNEDSCLFLYLTDRKSNCGYTSPFKGRVTSQFGWRKGKMHNGIDIGLLVGDTVRAAFRGKVRLARWQGGYGRVVIVRHFNGLETIYAHLSRFMVKEGEMVDPGTALGKGGKSGNSRGSHLHLETRFKGKPINPEAFIDFQNHQLKGDTLMLKKTKYGFIGYQPGGAYHKVRSGDYMYKIANEYGVTIKDICSLNGIRRNHFLVVGEELKVSN